MERLVLRLLLSGIVEALNQVTITRILTMPHRVTYHVLKTADFLAVTLLKGTGLLPGPMRIGAVLLFDICLPVACSRGKLSQRILRVFLVCICMITAELIGTAVFIAINGEGYMDSQVIDRAMESSTTMTAVYLVMTLVLAVLTELLVSICNALSKTDESFFGLSSVILVLGAFIILISDYVRLQSSDRVSVSSLVGLWLSLCGVYLVFYVARREAASQREAADAALAARKAKHTVAEVRAMAWRARGLEALRHALASDVREVPRLAASGQADNAARELSGLVEQAHILNGGER